MEILLAPTYVSNIFNEFFAPFLAIVLSLARAGV